MSPMQAIWSMSKPQPFDYCPKCEAAPFECFLRGMVARFDWFGLRKRVWCVICRSCKEIVGHEEIPAPQERP